MAKRARFVEHFLAVDGAACIPSQTLVEHGGKLKHLREQRHRADVPRRDVLVERRGALKRAVQRCDRARIPRRDVLVERFGLR